jgi:ABC-type phosphate transport system ATPase subunit
MVHRMDESRIGHVFPVGGPVPPNYMIGRTGEIDQLLTRLTESIHTMVSGERRIGKTTICDAACARLKPEMEIVRIEVPERKDADAGVFLQLIIDRCNTISRAAATARRVFRATRPAIESALDAAGVPLNLDELGAEPARLATRQILSLPRTLAKQLNRPVVFFMDELQRAIDYTDGAEILEALVDLYSGVSDVVVLVDGSDERILEHMRGAPVQFDKLCDRVAISPRIPKSVWHEALPERFGQVSLTITSDALASIVDFGGELPYQTMAAAQGAALAARRINIGSDHAEVGMFEADQGIEFARSRLADDI